MSYDVSTPSKPKSPFDHPSYNEGMDYLDKGQWQKAVGAIETLRELYPENDDVRDLLADINMRATVAQAQSRKKSKGSTKRLVRGIGVGVLVLIVISIIGLAVYKLWIEPTFLHEYRIQQLTALRQNADEAIIAGRYSEARQTLEEMRTIVPEDADIDETLQRVEQLEKITDLYNTAQEYMAGEAWDKAIEALTELQSLDAQYRAQPELLATAQEDQTLAQQFQTAEADFANGDWMSALDTYKQLHETSLTFKFDTIQNRLFESHFNYAQELMATAHTDSDQVTAALEHFAEALTVRPFDEGALNERRLAESYASALNTDDHNQAIDLLQTIYAERPDYAGYNAAELLYTALLTRADAQLAAGEANIALDDYENAADLPVADPSEAQEKSAELIAASTE